MEEYVEMKHLDTSANVGLDFMENDVKVSFNDLFTKKVSFFIFIPAYCLRLRHHYEYAFLRSCKHVFIVLYSDRGNFETVFI